MKGMLAVVSSIGLTALSWGLYGPTLHQGQHLMHPQNLSRLRPFMCVGIAYFVIAVLVPGLLLLRGETGKWTRPGTFWSLAAGAAGAIGALGIVMAFTFGGKPLYVMPLVFGCAPVVNTFLTMFMLSTFRQCGPKFYAGLIMVVTGAVMVMVFKPSPLAASAHAANLPHAPAVAAAVNMPLVIFFVAATALAWGVYGPVLHKGQATMAGSRLRPLICVGIAYFLIAVIVPGVMLAVRGEPGGWTVGGSIWSLAAGTAGAVGALGIIMAFNFGGKPIYVMQLEFGCAPVVNTLYTMINTKAYNAQPVFFLGLVLVAAGAVMVLVFAPKPGKKPAAPPPEPVAADVEAPAVEAP